MLDLDYFLSVLNGCSHSKALTKMTSNLSPVVYELEREIALLPVEAKLWLQAQIDKQIKSAALAQVDINPGTGEWSDEEWTDEEWTQLSLQGLSRAYCDDEPDYEILETRSKLEI
jgi:hypothetical protein